MTKEIEENSAEVTESFDDLRANLVYYQEQNAIVHLVLKNRRFYNGLIIQVREKNIIFEDKKIGRIPISLSEIYLMENFNEPNGGDKDDVD